MSDTDLAELNRQITDENGEIAPETTAPEDSAPQEQTLETDDATVEKSTEEGGFPKDQPKSENDPEMVELASDETGKRYVPENRFKEVYGKWKDAERRAKERGEVNPYPRPVAQQTQPVNKTDALEIELLRTQLPQFNPESADYSQEIDEMGYSIYESSKDKKGNYTITRLDAGRKALNMAKKLTSKVADLKLEARAVKAQQSDQGITNRVLTRETTQVDPDKMSLPEKEAWLKANGEW